MPIYDLIFLLTLFRLNILLLHIPVQPLFSPFSDCSYSTTTAGLRVFRSQHDNDKITINNGVRFLISLSKFVSKKILIISSTSHGRFPPNKR